MTLVDISDAGVRAPTLAVNDGVRTALADGQDMLCRVIGQVGEGVAVFDLDDRLIYANPALGVLHGCHSDDLLGRPVTSMLGAAGSSARERAAWEDLGDDVVRLETRGRRPDGVTVDIEVAISWLRDDDQARVGRIVCVRDISARKRLERQLERLGLHDPLTGLPNRRLLEDRLEHALAGADRSGCSLAVLFIDLDGFKLVNDRHGHAVGDQVLREAAARFGACVRGADTLARLGGDEFVVLMGSLDHARDAEDMATRLRQALLAPFQVGGGQVVLSASVGIAVASGDDRRDLLRAADSAMYEAKHAGPGRTVTSRPHPRGGADRGLTADEDQALRTLHWLETFGMELSAARQALKADMHARDLRDGIRDPTVDLVLLPIETGEEPVDTGEGPVQEVPTGRGRPSVPAQGSRPRVRETFRG